MNNSIEPKPIDKSVKPEFEVYLSWKVWTFFYIFLSMSPTIIFLKY